MTSSSSPSNQNVLSQDLNPEMPELLSTELCGLKPGTESQAPLSSLFVDEETETERG